MANQQQFMAMANLDGRFPTARFAACAGRLPRVDGRFPTARFAACAGRLPRVDGRFPTARFAVLTARSLRPPLDGLPAHSYFVINC